jgi:hypothetical protein
LGTGIRKKPIPNPGSRGKKTSDPESGTLKNRDTERNREQRYRLQNMNERQQGNQRTTILEEIKR